MNERVKHAQSAQAGRKRQGAAVAEGYSQFSHRIMHAEPAMHIQQIRDGIEAGVLVDASRHFDITQQLMGQLLGIPSTTLARWIKDRKHLGSTETQRLARIAKIESEAEVVFGSSEKAKEWLFSENKALGEMPITMLDTDTGTSEVRKMLSAIAYGGAA